MTEQSGVQVNLVKQIFNILDRDHKELIGKYELGVFAQAIDIPLFNKELNSVLQVYGQKGKMNCASFLQFVSDSLGKHNFIPD
jgi:Ca2+-binding EF-hand superfamily protein